MAIKILVISLCILLVQCACSVPLSKELKATKPLEWWQETVIYQIYPRSFQDSDGNGVGDLNGITSRLDYFVDLGIEAIWISPIYTSPMKDFGYDISDFRDIEPQFGTMEDFKRMSEEFKKRGIKLIMDIVPNHSSDEHEWFNKSINRIEPYTDYYVWRDAKGRDSEGKPIPPNNWVSNFGGSGWEWNEQRQQFYYHQFVIGQPDLNYENIAVRNEMLAIVKFWLDLGVDGIRVDAVPFLYEDQAFPDDVPNLDRDPSSRPDEWRYWAHKWNFNLNGTFEFLADMRQLLDVYSYTDGYTRCMMVEAVVEDEIMKKYYGEANHPVSHFPFNFLLLDVKSNNTASDILSLIDRWHDIVPEGRWPTFLLGNHDRLRVPTRWTEESIDAANMINLLLQGTAVTYNGEEIGMSDTFLTWEETVDPAGCNTDPERYHLFSRDPARTPMQWSNTTSAGFSTSNSTWLPLNKNYPTVNVAAQLAAEESHIKVYKDLLKLRHTDAWRYGDLQTAALNSDRVLGFSRIPEEGLGFLVLINLSNDDVTASSTVFRGVPNTGILKIRSVNFKNRGAIVGGSIDTRSVILGPRDSLVVEFTPVR